MPRYSGANYGGDYDEVTAAKLADVGLPERLLCKSCGLDKPLSQYSKRQKSNLCYNIFRYHKKNALGAGDNTIVCRACTPQVNNELLCIMCDHVKDLASFAKNHRNNPEQARCKECMYEQIMNDQPGLEEYSEESGSEWTNPHESDNDLESDTGGTLPLTLDNLHLTEGPPGSSHTSDGRKKILSSRLPLSSTSRSGENSTVDDAFGKETSTEDDLRSNASTIGGVDIGSDFAAIGSRASVSTASIIGDDNRAEAMTAASRWERMRKTGYRVGSIIAESDGPTRSEKGKGRAFTGYDPQGTPHRRYRAESVNSETGSISNTTRNKFPRVRPEFPSAKSTGNRNVHPSRDDVPRTIGHHIGYDDDDDDDDEGEMFI